MDGTGSAGRPAAGSWAGVAAAGDASFAELGGGLGALVDMVAGAGAGNARRPAAGLWAGAAAAGDAGFAELGGGGFARLS